MLLTLLTRSNKLLVELLCFDDLLSADAEAEAAAFAELEVCAAAKPHRKRVVASIVRMFIFDCDFEY